MAKKFKRLVNSLLNTNKDLKETFESMYPKLGTFEENNIRVVEAISKEICNCDRCEIWFDVEDVDDSVFCKKDNVVLELCIECAEQHYEEQLKKHLYKKPKMTAEVVKERLSFKKYEVRKTVEARPMHRGAAALQLRQEIKGNSTDEGYLVKSGVNSWWQDRESFEKNATFIKD